MDASARDDAARWWNSARQRWPSLAASEARFSSFIAERDEAKEQHAADLYLACACWLGDEQAIRAFRERHEDDVRSAVRKSIPTASVDDAVQHVFAKLLVSVGDQPPGISKYGGRGKLETWVRVVARRAALNLHRGATPERHLALRETDVLLNYASNDAVLGSLKREYREAFRAAFASAIEQLSARQRNLLRYECIDRLSRKEIAQLFGVTTMTVSRWRAATRVKLRTLTRDVFVTSAGIEKAEFDSAMNLIASQLEVSLSRLLRDDSE